MADEEIIQEKRVRGTPVYTSGDGKELALTPDGLALVTHLAGHRKNQDFIASRLGITKSLFRKMLSKPDDTNPVRLAYEKGFADHAEWHRKLMQKHAEKNPVAAMFYGKAYLGIRENEPQVEVKTESRIQITLPSALSFAETLYSLGQTEVADFRKDKRIPLKELPFLPLVGDKEPKTQEELDAQLEALRKREAELKPRVCSPTHIAYLKSHGLYDPKVHLAAKHGEETK